MAFSDKDKALIKLIRDNMKITKVVCTRALKTRNGDFFVGFSAAWDSTQEDAGGMGADVIDAMDEGDAQKSAHTCGMSLREAKIAGYILAMQTDLQVQDHALAGGGISAEEHGVAQKAVRRNYNKLLSEFLDGEAK